MASINVTEPTINHRIYQRSIDSNHVANITISGSYSGTPNPTSIDVQVVKESDGSAVTEWINTVANGGSFLKIVSVPQGGWYKLKARFNNDHTVVDTTINVVGVGVIVGVIGQSNAGAIFGRFGGSGTDTPSSLVYTYVIGKDWVQPTAIGAVNLGNGIADVLNVPVGLLNYGVGSSALSQDHNIGGGWWLGTPANWTAFKTAVDVLGGIIEAVYWLQGETEGGVSYDLIYDQNLAAFYTQLKNGCGANVIIVNSLLSYSTSYGALDARWEQTRDWQKSVSNADPNAVYVATYDYVPIDGVHFNNASLVKAGDRGAQAILYKMGEVDYYRGPTIIGFTIVDSTHTDIRIVHRAGGNDFNPESGISGFEIFDNGVEKSISAAERVDNRTIRLTHEAITGTLTCRYMYGQTCDHNSAVMDNSNLVLPLDGMSNIPEDSALSHGPLPMFYT